MTVWQQCFKGKSFWVPQDKYVVFVCFHGCIAVTFVLEHIKNENELNREIKSSGKAINSIKDSKTYQNLGCFGQKHTGKIKEENWARFALSFKMLLEGFQNEDRNSEQ